MKFKKIICSLLTLCVGATAACSMAACGGKSGPYSYEIWISSNEASAYSNYNDNLAVKYWNTLEFMGSDGELHDTNVKFYTAGANAMDEFNTMMGSQNFYDVMDLSQTSYTASELYNDGMLLDLTPYMQECMPNYLAWLASSGMETYAKTAVDSVGGTKKYLQIYTYHDTVEQWGGWQYRRDWIAKYGEDTNGTPFDYSYDENGYLVDNIIFPSYYDEDLRDSYNDLLLEEGLEKWEGKDPVFISDWEWMFEIFKEALADLGVSNGNADNGYPFGIYYPGFIETGDLVSAFGGNSADFYIDKDGSVKNGIVSDNFKEYTRAMNGWYNEGYIDKYFDEKSSAQFYETDSRNVWAGRVGMFYSSANTELEKIASIAEENSVATPFTNGAYVAGARQPINDKYSTYSAAAKYVPDENEFLPRVFFSTTKEYNSIGLTVKLTDEGKDIKALLRMIDHLYEENNGSTPGGCMLASAGLTKEQYDKVGKTGDFYDAKKIQVEGVDKKLSETGTYYWDSTTEKFTFVGNLATSDTILNPAFLNKFVGLHHQGVMERNRTTNHEHVRGEWNFYESKRFLPSFLRQLDADSAKTYNRCLDNVRNDTSTAVANIIKGRSFNNTSYGQLMYKINQRGVADVCTSLQSIYDVFYE